MQPGAGRLDSRKQHRGPHAVYHTETKTRSKGIRGDRVFVGTLYFYLGKAAVPIPPRFDSLIRRRRSVQYHEGAVVDAFVAWLEHEHTPGIRGLRRDQERGDAAFRAECDLAVW